MINSVNNQGYLNPYPAKQYLGNGLDTLQVAGRKNLVNSLFFTSDTVTLSSSSKSSITYNTPPAVDMAKGDGFDMLRGLVLNMLKQQGIDTKIANGDSTIDLSKISQEDAQKLIAENGYFGVDQTSDRIVNFAIASAGADPSKLDVVKTGVDKGFKEALQALGGTLPNISYNTYDAVMNKLDTWAQAGNDNQVTQTIG